MSAYLRPDTMDMALASLSDGTARVLAGGTDLYPATQNATLSGDYLDLSAVPGLRGISQSQDGLRIGAYTTWTDLIRAPLPPALHALQQAAAEVGGRQIQNAGTLGGNLCNASPAADGVPPLLVVDAVVELASAKGTRQMPLADFLQGPRQTARRKDEVMTAIIVPSQALGGASHFLKLGARAYLVISIAMVAARVIVDDSGHITGAALAVGACAATARRLAGAEAALIDQHITTARIDPVLVAESLSPMDDLRATATYRTHAATELLRRALATLAKVTA